MKTERIKKTRPAVFRSAILFIAVASAALTSCSSDNENVGTATDSRVALQVSSGIQTRAAGSTWTAGDAIGIYSLNGTTAEYSNCQYATANGGTNGTFTPATSDQTIYFPVDGSTRDIIAYYPYSASVADGVYTVDVSNQSNQEAIDLMTSALVSGKHKDDASVNLQFAHKLSKIEISIKPGNGITAADLAGMTVTLTNQIATGSINVTTDGSSVTAATDATATTLTLNTATDGTSAEAIVLPAASTTGMNLVFQLSGFDAPFTWAVANATESKSFAAGNKYVYTITVNRIGIQVTATITDWTAGNGTDGETGNAE